VHVNLPDLSVCEVPWSNSTMRVPAVIIGFALLDPPLVDRRLKSYDAGICRVVQPLSDIMPERDRQCSHTSNTNLPQPHCRAAFPLECGRLSPVGALAMSLIKRFFARKGPAEQLPAKQPSHPLHKLHTATQLHGNTADRLHV
jgi:hypothetical protein